MSRTRLNPTPVRAPRPAGRGLAVALVAVLLLLAGCKPNKRYDLIEAELRTRERELAEARLALEQARNLNRAYVQQAPSAVPPPAAGGTAAVVVREVVLGRGTGGVDDDGRPGDEGLLVVVVPRDEDGTPVKVPGYLQVAAWEIAPTGVKTPIGYWTIPPDRLRPTWRNGLVSTGFFVPLSWQTYPGSEKVRVAVRLTTPDGQVFEADRDIRVRLVPLPRAEPPSVVPPSPSGGPAGPPASVPPPREPLFPDPLPPGTEELPPPQTGGRGVRPGPPVTP